MDNKMKHENDKWLEQQLKSTPQIDDDNFTMRIQTLIDTRQLKQQKNRKIILLTTYFLSTILLLWNMPWDILMVQINATSTQLANIINVETETQFPFIALSVLLIVSLTAYVIGQETN